MPPVRLTETTPLSEAGTSTSGRMKVHAISAGLGSSGYYSPEVIEAAATAQLITQGTPLFLDHPSETDRHDRPERSVRDIAAVFTEAATYDKTAQALVGEIQVFAPYRDLLNEMAPHIGLSISGSATDIVEGDVDGKRVPVVEGLAVIDSVDFVTRAGRGGKVVELFESALVNKRALEHDGVTEATVNDTREALQNLLRDAYGGDKTYIWVRDFDDSTVWFEIETGDGSGVYGQPYTEADGVVALSGDRAEVRVRTEYVPVTRPDSTNPTTTESTEDNMAKIQIEESAHTELTEKAGRVDVLESENATQKARITELEESAAATARANRARVLIVESGHTFDEFQVDGLLGRMTLTEGDAPVLDEEKFKTTVTEAATKVTAPASTGLTGFGASAASTEVAESSRPTTNAWGRPLAEQKGA